MTKLKTTTPSPRSFRAPTRNPANKERALARTSLIKRLDTGFRRYEWSVGMAMNEVLG